MIEQQGNALTAYAFFTASKQGATGLTVTVNVYEGTNGTPIVDDGNATELAGGLYYYTLASASVDAEGAYIFLFATTDGSVDQQHIPAIWVVDVAGVEHLDADMSSVPTAAAIADAVMDEPLSGHTTTGTAGKALGEVGGTGATEHTITLQDDGSNPIADADVWISSDADGSTVVASGQTNSAGQFSFFGDTGVTYYIWAQKDGIDFTNPTSFST